MLDTRRATTFTQGFISNSISIGLEGRFAEWAGVLLPFDKPILIVAAPGTEREAVIRLARVGFSLINGYLKGGYESWKEAGEPIDMIIDVEPDEMAMDIPHDPKLVVVDVRRETEFGDSHIVNAVNLPLDELNDPVNISNFDEDLNFYVHCGTGYRSVIAASLIKRQGIHNIRNLLGGFEKIREQQNIKLTKENSVLN